MEEWRKWAERRRITLTLSLLFTTWFIFQMMVFQQVGENFARWLFYFQQPPNTISPGILFAPLSHKFKTLTHIGPNLLFLLIAGGFAEPYIGERRVLSLSLGLGFASLWMANATAFIHELWIIAGPSGGILSLWAYAGASNWQKALEFRDGRHPFSSEGVEQVTALLLLSCIPVFPIWETFALGTFHSGHTIGLLLGLTVYAIESIPYSRA